nr:odorant receptor [Semanotus bifasciatus]
MYFSNLNYSMKMMNIIGVHPEKGKSVIQILLFSMVLTMNLGTSFLIISLFVKNKDTMALADITGVFQSIFIIFHGTLKLITLYIKRSSLLDLLKRSTNVWDVDEIENEEVIEACIKTIKNLRYFCVFFLITAILTSSSFVLRPVILEDMVFNSYVPKNMPVLILDGIQAYVFLVGIFVPTVTFDIFFVSLTILIQVQFKILNCQLKEILHNSRHSKHRIPFQAKLKAWINHHNDLFTFVDKINETVAMTLLLYFGDVICSMCLELYNMTVQKSLSELLKSVIYIVTELFQLVVIFSIPSQMLTDEAGNTVNSVWLSEWYETSTSTQFCLKQIMLRSQRPLSISCGKFRVIDLSTCLATIKTIVSYYMFLRTMGSKNN